MTNWGYGMENEVVRIIKNSPAWVPAVQDGKQVQAYRKQPITFVVIDESIDITTQTPYTFYVGKENWMTIDIRKVKPENLDVFISGGKIRDSERNYIVTVDKPGNVLVTIYDKKKNKVIAEVRFEAISK